MIALWFFVHSMPYNLVPCLHITAVHIYNIHFKCIRHQNVTKRGKNAQTGRVRSMLEPQFQAAPEKFVITSATAELDATLEQPHQSQNHQPYQQLDEFVEILGNQFPAGSKAVTIQRGAKGFGLVIGEGKVRGNHTTTLSQF